MAVNESIMSRGFLTDKAIRLIDVWLRETEEKNGWELISFAAYSRPYTAEKKPASRTFSYSDELHKSNDNNDVNVGYRFEFSAGDAKLFGIDILKNLGGIETPEGETIETAFAAHIYELAKLEHISEDGKKSVEWATPGTVMGVLHNLLLQPHDRQWLRPGKFVEEIVSFMGEEYRIPVFDYRKFWIGANPNPKPQQ